MTVSDPARRDQVTEVGQRNWNVYLYYPARRGGARERYAADAGLLTRMARDQYYDLPSPRFGQWAQRPSPAAEDAPAVTPQPVPLIVLLPGQGVAAFNYAELSSRIVKAGYAVAVVDAPYLGFGRGPDGVIRAASDDRLLRDTEQSGWGPRFAQWSRDVRVSIDRLASAREVRDLGLLLDTGRVVVAGHSLGGAVALDSCGTDARIVACADFEGAPFGTRIEKVGPEKPTLFVLSRAAIPGRTQERPSPDNPLFSFLVREGGPPAWGVTIAGGSHMSFSDAPETMPETLSRFGGELMASARSFEVYVTLLTRFAGAYRIGKHGAVFRDTLRGLPEASGAEFNDMKVRQ